MLMCSFSPSPLDFALPPLLSVCMFTAFPASGLSSLFLFPPSSGLPCFPQPLQLLNPFFLSFLHLLLCMSCCVRIPVVNLWVDCFFHMVNISAGAWGGTSTWPEGVPTAPFYFLWNCEATSGTPGIQPSRNSSTPLRSEKTPPLLFPPSFRSNFVLSVNFFHVALCHPSVFFHPTWPQALPSYQLSVHCPAMTNSQTNRTAMQHLLPAPPALFPVVRLHTRSCSMLIIIHKSILSWNDTQLQFGLAGLYLIFKWLKSHSQHFQTPNRIFHQAVWQHCSQQAMCLTCHAPKAAVYFPLRAPEMQIVRPFFPLCSV